MTTQPRLRLGLAQLDFLVGDVQGNAERMIAELQRAASTLQPDLILFPELALSGYPPEDLLFHGGFRQAVDAALTSVREAVGEVAALVGYPEYTRDALHNSAVLLGGGRVLANHRKRQLPNYKVFDENRYFRKGRETTVV